jgi:hypothetical protein
VSDTTIVHLTDAELVFLDGKCGPKIQTEVDAAKGRLEAVANLGCEPHIARFVADVVRTAKQDGKLIHHHENLRVCDYCGRRAGYAKHTRHGRWHKKGDDDHKRPLTFSGVDLRHQFISMRGHANLGCCNDCFAKAKPILAMALGGVQAEVPDSITGQSPTFKRYDNVQCQKCQWTGHEGQMGLCHAIMGGTYPGKCPKCGAENLFLGPTNIKTTQGFTLVPTTTPVTT